VTEEAFNLVQAALMRRRWLQMMRERQMGVIGRAMTREEEAEMVAQHKKGCELARAGMDCPPGAHLALVSGWQGERRRMAEEQKRPPIDPTTGRPANYRKEDGTWVTIAED
jgi:hypothetical protein